MELIEGLADDEVSLYRQGDFVDLCRGPHLVSTGRVAAFKLLSIAGAYWRGDEKRQMLQRIYGTAWATKDELDAYLKKLEEIERRDHRRLGKELDLFSVHEETGAGLILWHPKGARLRQRHRELLAGGALPERLRTRLLAAHRQGPALADQRSPGFLPREHVLVRWTSTGRSTIVKPMNCPFHIMIYKSRGWSYRDLPIRWAELGTVYRYERSGALHGLLRVRGFTQDDAHLFCRPDQMPAEIDRVLAFSLHHAPGLRFPGLQGLPGDQTQGRSPSARRSAGPRPRRPWKNRCKRAEIDYEVDEGGGAFYGPKIDIKIKDALGREWQCTTIQFDFNMPERFDLTYRGSDGKDHRPYMIHRALLGSIERFFGVLDRALRRGVPAWLAPGAGGGHPGGRGARRIRGEGPRGTDPGRPARGGRCPRREAGLPHP